MKTLQADILQLMEAIANERDFCNNNYSNQHTLISSMYKNRTYDECTIYLRLVVIDSLYSTNAAYSYFSFEEMAEKIFSLGTEQQARDYFYSIACGEKDEKGVFTEPYGIRKNLSEGSKQMSLLSKYAYYALMAEAEQYPLGFPIYDKLAKAIYPVIFKQFFPKEKPEKNLDEIENYVKALDNLRKQIFGDSKNSFGGKQQFDILDAYLWRMGKIDGGNFSLLLSREHYVSFVESTGLKALKDENDKEYKMRMGGSKFDFNKALRAYLIENKDPFGKLPSKTRKYMNALLKHWKTYILS